jgi:hypothetical protein
VFIFDSSNSHYKNRKAIKTAQMLKSKLNSSVKRDLSNYLAYNTALGKPATAQAEGKGPQFMESPA